MKVLVLVISIVCSPSFYAQTWFQGGVGSGATNEVVYLCTNSLFSFHSSSNGGSGAIFNQVNYCDSNLMDPPYQANLSGFSGFSSNHVDYCSSIYLGEFGSGFFFVEEACVVALPVELLFFEVTKLEGRVARIDWRTNTEQNNDFFIVQRSHDGFIWSDFLKVNGAGNSLLPIDYLAFDENLEIGITYYRLKQVDFDGAFTFSNIRHVQYSSDGNQNIIIYPNPSNGIVFVQFENIQDEKFSVFNNLGQNVTGLLNQTMIGQDKMMLDFSGLNKGVYFFKTSNYFKKVIIN